MLFVTLFFLNLIIYKENEKFLVKKRHKKKHLFLRRSEIYSLELALSTLEMVKDLWD